MKAKILLFTLAVVMLASPLALADTFVGTSTGSWTALPSVGAGGINNNSSPFFDGASTDGSPIPYNGPHGIGPGNVGFVLQPYQNLDYWAAQGGGPGNVYFLNSDGNSEKVVLLFEIAGNRNSNQLYVFNVSNPANVIPVFNGSVDPGEPASTTTITIPNTWGGYGLKLVGPGGTFYSIVDPVGSAYNSSDSTSNFAFFAPHGSYSSTGTPGQFIGNAWYVGIEDLTDGAAHEGCYGDFQDMVIKISSVPVPASVLLLGSGLVGLLGLGWRKRSG